MDCNYNNVFWGNIYKESKMSGSTKLLKAMILYSLPLVMNALAWWLNNASDRYILTFFCGTAINGIYAVSYKIPTILSTIQTIFIMLGAFLQLQSLIKMTEMDL